MSVTFPQYAFNSYPVSYQNDPQPAPTDGSIAAPGRYIVPADTMQNLSRQDITYQDRYGKDGKSGKDGVMDTVVYNVKGHDVEGDGQLDGDPVLRGVVVVDQVAQTVSITDQDKPTTPVVFEHTRDGRWLTKSGNTDNIDLLGAGTNPSADGTDNGDTLYVQLGTQAAPIILKLYDAEGADGRFIVQTMNNVTDLTDANYDADDVRIGVGVDPTRLPTADNKLGAGEMKTVRFTLDRFPQDGGLPPREIDSWEYLPENRITV